MSGRTAMNTRIAEVLSESAADRSTRARRWSFDDISSACSRNRLPDSAQPSIPSVLPRPNSVSLNSRDDAPSQSSLIKGPVERALDT